MKRIDYSLLDSLAATANANARRRQNFNLHSAYNDPVQRLLNAMAPGTYVRPHRHPERDKWELFVVLRGALGVLIFDPQGQVTERVELRASGPTLGVEIPVATWHTLVVLAPDTIALEIKRGPYTPLHDKDFASWAPAEGTSQAQDFVAWFERAQIGSAAPSA